MKRILKVNDSYSCKNDNDIETNFEMKINQDFNIQLCALKTEMRNR